jgi:hypothetical protein
MSFWRNPFSHKHDAQNEKVAMKTAFVADPSLACGRAGRVGA